DLEWMVVRPVGRLLNLAGPSGRRRLARERFALLCGRPFHSGETATRPSRRLVHVGISIAMPTLSRKSPMLQDNTCGMPAFMHNAGMANAMPATERPTRLTADGAFFVCGGRLVVRTPGVHPGNVSSNLAPRTKWDPAVGSSPAPCLSPRDWAPKRST